MNTITLVLPYYCQPAMLRRQAEEWAKYTEQLRVIVVDDGSPEHPAHHVLPWRCRARIYRIDADIPWNRNGARNLGTRAAATEWVLHTDLDHVLPAEGAERLVEMDLDPEQWYRFARFRVGQADETRHKDDLPDSAEFGPVKPHVDSFLCTRARYWAAGGYDEDYSGSLGGSAPFLAHMADISGPVLLDDVALHVYTRSSVPDASETRLDRGRERYDQVRAAKRSQGDPKPATHVRFPWSRVR